MYHKQCNTTKGYSRILVTDVVKADKNNKKENTSGWCHAQLLIGVKINTKFKDIKLNIICSKINLLQTYACSENNNSSSVSVMPESCLMLEFVN